MEVEPILVGREVEIESIIGNIGQALSGKGSLVLISGEAGIGKTRVMNEAADIARKTGFIVLQGRCIPGNSPYLPFYEAFTSHTRSPFESQSESESRAMKDSSIMLFKILEFLSEESEKAPILVCLDDLHWADSVTVQLLHFLARNIRSLRVAIAGTYRTEEIIAEEGESAPPLRDSIRLMVREGIVNQVPLDRLDDQAIIELIESMLFGRVHETVTHRIVIESGGNPLFAVETVRMLVTSELIVLEEGGVWGFTDSDAITLPSTVQEVILRRLERLPKDQRRLLECASVVGKSFDSNLLQQVLELNRMQVLDSLDSLENRYQLVKSEGEEYWFGHERIRDVAYDQIAPIRRKELHGRVGDYLESRLHDDKSFATLSFHFYQAGQSEKSLDYSIRAGEYFLGESGGTEAIKYFQRASDNIKMSGNHKKEKLRALIGLGDSFVELLNFQSAQNAYDQAYSLELDPYEEGQLLWRMAHCHGPTALGKGSTSLAWELIDRASLISDMDDFDTAMILAEKAELSRFEGKPDIAEQSYLAAEMMLRKTERKDRLMDLMDSYAGFLYSQGRVRESISKMESLCLILSESKSSLSSLKHELGWAQALLTIGEEEKASEHLKSAHTLACKLGHNIIHFAIHYDSSGILMMRGDYLGARNEFLKALEIAQAIEHPILRTRAYAVLAQIDIMIGMIDEAEELIDKARELTESYEWSIKTPARGLIILAQAMLTGVRGRNEECIRQSENAIDVLSGGMREPVWEAMSRQTLGIFLLRLGKQDEAFKHLTKAREIFSSLENERQVKRIDLLLTEFEPVEKHS